MRPATCDADVVEGEEHDDDDDDDDDDAQSDVKQSKARQGMSVDY